MNNAMQIMKEMNRSGNKKRALASQRYFKTKKGEYGEGDIFLGFSMPEQRIIAARHRSLSFKDIQKLLQSKVHEHRMVALIILTLRYSHATEIEQKKIYVFYIHNTRYINNWDLVDVTAPRIVGAFLLNKKKSKLYSLAKSGNLWERRIAILATLFFIQHNKLDDTFAIAKMLLHDHHDLIHKAVGWMLRESGKMNQKKLEYFLTQRANSMSRTTLRYAIERFPEKKRKFFLQLKPLT